MDADADTVTILPFHFSRGKPPTQLIALLDALGVPYEQWTSIEHPEHYQITLLIPKAEVEYSAGKIQAENYSNLVPKTTPRLAKCDLEVLKLMKGVKRRMTTGEVLDRAAHVSCGYSDAAIKNSLAKLHAMGKLTNRHDVKPCGYALS